MFSFISRILEQQRYQKTARIMDYISLLLSFGYGAVAGVLYGFYFLNYKKILVSGKNSSATAKRIFTLAWVVFFALFRYVLLGLGAWYILHTPSLSIILVLASFLGSFWIVIARKKAYLNEQH